MKSIFSTNDELKNAQKNIKNYLKNFTFRLSLYVPWNEVVVLSAVQLGRTEVHVQVPELYTSIPTCTPHDYNRMQPVILSSWHTNYR